MITMVQVYVHIADDRGDQIGDELQKSLRQKPLCLLNVIALGQYMTDPGAVLSVCVMGFPKLYGLVCFARSQIRFRDSPLNHLLTDLQVFVLRQLQTGLLQKLQRAVKQGLVPASKPNARYSAALALTI